MIFSQFLLMLVCLVFVLIAELAKIVTVITLTTVEAETALLHQRIGSIGQAQLLITH